MDRQAGKGNTFPPTANFFPVSEKSDINHILFIGFGEKF
jgi:hypothetical protein